MLFLNLMLHYNIVPIHSFFIEGHQQLVIMIQIMITSDLQEYLNKNRGILDK